LHLKKR